MKGLIHRILFLITSVLSRNVLEDSGFWRNEAERDLRKMLDVTRLDNRAKNVIIFIGDGMGLQTHAMARIFKGQQAGQSGEESSLVWENFPFTGLIKTYNTDKQVPDSAGTATALFTGTKTRFGMIGMDMMASYNVCDTRLTPLASVSSIADWGQEAGKRVGLVSTARITHATPAAVYAHSANRDWESDTSSPDQCGDIAQQLVDSLASGKLNFAMGGGRANFRTEENGGNRRDRDLVEHLTSNGGKVLETGEDLEYWDFSDKTLGLFSDSHMEWEVNRLKDTTKSRQPSLTEMTTQALRKLKRADEDGFVLIVEGGRIDHAHHQNQAKKALIETVELEKAVKAAMEMTEIEETLIIVTADHSHSVTFNGYPKRGNDILGTFMDPRRYYVSLNQSQPRLAPYTTISYANGPGFAFHYNTSTGFWRDLTNVDTTADEYQQLASFYLPDETHGGEDVPIYAIGPQAHLLTGVHEQSYIAHLMAYSACLKQYSFGCPEPASSSTIPKYSFTIVIVMLILYL